MEHILWSYRLRNLPRLLPLLPQFPVILFRLKKQKTDHSGIPRSLTISLQFTSAKNTGPHISPPLSRHFQKITPQKTSYRATPLYRHSNTKFLFTDHSRFLGQNRAFFLLFNPSYPIFIQQIISSVHLSLAPIPFLPTRPRPAKINP